MVRKRETEIIGKGGKERNSYGVDGRRVKGRGGMRMKGRGKRSSCERGRGGN